jgi:hypothetical protein
MGGYGYEIFGGVLIVLSSLVGEEMKHKWKVVFYLFFGAVAIAYSGIGIYLRRDANIREMTERQESKNELKGVRQDLSNLLTAFSGLGPSVASLNSDVAVMRKDLEMAKGKPDPHAIAELEARANVAQQRVDNASKAYLVALVPTTVRQLRSWHGSWSSPEGKELIASADSLRQGLLQGLRPTPEDTAASALFENRASGYGVGGYGAGGFGGSGYVNWDPERAARYLEALMMRTGIPLPPSELSVTAP